MGSPYAFMTALTAIILWALSGRLFGYSDTWQLVINTGTTIVTFLMVFLIQNTQNRDARAMQLKLDELIRTGKGARNELLNAEEIDEEQLEKLHDEFREMHEKYADALEKRRKNKSSGKKSNSKAKTLKHA